MQRRGFTIVELLIAITVMGILLVIAVVALSSSQRNARDDERKVDVQTITSHLEDYYNGANSSGVTGRYPTTSLTASEASIKTALRDVSTSTFIAPGSTSTSQTFIAATNATQTPEGVAPQPTVTTYVYQPLQANGALCTGDVALTECRKFNIYYRLENDTTVKITSRHQ